MLNGPSTRRNSKDSETFRPMPACADCAGCHESLLFANLLCFLFTDDASYFELLFLKNGHDCDETKTKPNAYKTNENDWGKVALPLNSFPNTPF